MVRTIVSRLVQAPAERVFAAIAEVRRLPEVIPDVVRVELLSDQTYGVGTRFRETRTMKGREATTELEVTEQVENERVRMVADSHGTVWDSVFALRPAGEGTELTLTMEARAHALLPRLLNPLMKGLIARGLEKHMDAVKEHCERPAGPAAG